MADLENHPVPYQTAGVHHPTSKVYKGRFSSPDTSKIYPDGYRPVATDKHSPDGASHPGRKPSTSPFSCDGYDICPQRGVVRVTLPSAEVAEVDEHQSYMGLALVVTLCFNCPIGILALLIAYASRRAFLAGNERHGGIHAKISLAVSMLGVLATIAIVIAVVWYAVGQQKEKQNKG